MHTRILNRTALGMLLAAASACAPAAGDHSEASGENFSATAGLGDGGAEGFTSDGYFTDDLHAPEDSMGEDADLDGPGASYNPLVSLEHISEHGVDYRFDIDVWSDGTEKIDVMYPMGAAEPNLGRCGLETFLMVADQDAAVPHELVESCSTLEQVIEPSLAASLLEDIEHGELPELKVADIKPANLALTFEQVSADEQVSAEQSVRKASQYCSATTFREQVCPNLEDRLGQQTCARNTAFRCITGINNYWRVAGSRPSLLDSERTTVTRWRIAACGTDAKYRWRLPGETWTAEITVPENYVRDMRLYAGTTTRDECGWGTFSCPKTRYYGKNYWQWVRPRVTGAGRYVNVAGAWADMYQKETWACPLEL